MKQRIIALMLALVLALSVCGASALAEEQEVPDGQPAEDSAGERAESTAPGASADETGNTEDGDGEDAPSLAGPDSSEETDAYEPDAVGSISFANVERRIRENNFSVLALEETIASIEDIDYDKMYDDIRHQLNSIAKMQHMLLEGNMGDSYTYAQLDQAYGAARKQFDAIRDGDLQKDNAAAVHQLKNLQDQVIMAGESLYAALVQMEVQEASLQRQVTALNRTVAEMELRYQLGQISALQLEQTKAGRTSLVSGLSTLQMNIQNYKTQLEMLIGANLTGSIQLGAVPEVTVAQLQRMDLEADMAAAEAVSYELYAANETLKDAKETYIDSLTGTYYLRDSAKHTWESAQYTYSGTVQNYELSFRTLYAQVGDYKQILEASKVSLASQQASFASTELKYQQGTISKNALLSAEDDLRAAEGSVQSAAIDLFTAYNTYCWAVQHGILN